MLRKIISLITIATLLINTAGLTGCAAQFRSTSRGITVEELSRGDVARNHTLTVITPQDTIKFEENFARVDTTTMALVGFSSSHGAVTVPLGEIVSIEARKSQGSKLAFIGATGFFLAVIWIVVENWPGDGILEK